MAGDATRSLPIPERRTIMGKIVKRLMVFAATLALVVSFTTSFDRTVMAAGTPSSISLNKKNVTMTAGSKVTLKVKSVKPKAASKKVTWKSSNKKVASVSSKGVVTAKKAGTVTITAKAAKGKAASKCKIKVKKAKKGKVLVAYFSATGTTEGVAKKVAKASGGKLYEIVPQKAYTSVDLNYNNDNCRANREMENENARPAIKGSVKNMANYDVIYIGFPIWWETAPRIIDTFVESYDFSGKTIIPFCTSGSSGISTASSDLKKLCNGNPTWKKGRRFEGSASQSTVNKWVNGLGLK